MTPEDILQLGRLSRIALTSAEITDFTSSLDAIVAYVSTVKDITASEGSDAGADTTPALGARYNVLRPDAITHPSGTYTDVLLQAMPKRDGQYLSVKKILNPTE